MPLKSAHRRQYVEAESIPDTPSLMATGWALPVTPPLPVLPDGHGAVLVPNGLAGAGAVGPLPGAGNCSTDGSATWSVNGSATGSAMMQATPADEALCTVCTGAGGTTVAARTVGSAGAAGGGTAITCLVVGCDWVCARVTGAGETNFDTGASTGANTGTCGGRTGSRGTGTARSTPVTVDFTVDDADAAPSRPSESSSGNGNPTNSTMLFCWPKSWDVGSSCAWPIPDPSSHPATTSPPSTATRSSAAHGSARSIPRGAHRAPPASGMAATDSPSTLPRDRPCAGLPRQRPDLQPGEKSGLPSPGQSLPHTTRCDR
jgi:hypothetical protein